MSGILPLQFRPTPNVGTVYDPSVQVTNAQQLLQFKQQQDQVERQNALMGIFRDPKSLDGTGNPTPDTLQKIGAIDPPMMMKIRENMMIGQERQLRAQALSSDLMAQKIKMIGDASAGLLDTYKEAIKNGTPPDQAMREAQAGLVANNKKFAEVGVFNPDEVKRFETTFDPAKFEQIAAGSKQHQDWVKEQRLQEDEKRKQKHDEDVNYNKATTEEVDNAGRPYTHRPNAPVGQQNLYDDGAAVPSEKRSGATRMGTGTASAATQDRAATANVVRSNLEAELGRPVNMGDPKEKAELDRRVLAAEDARKINVAAKTAEERQAATSKGVDAVVDGTKHQQVIWKYGQYFEPDGVTPIHGPVQLASTARADQTLADREKAAAERADTGVPQTPDQKAAVASQVASGEPMTQIIPGWGPASRKAQQEARNDAIQLIRDQTGMDALDAGLELANRGIEYASGKKAQGVQQTMLSTTRTAVKQLDYNIDKVKEELTKLKSTNISPVVNAILRKEEEWTGDPNLSSLFYSMSAVGMESARILSGGSASIQQLHEGAANEARKWANIGMTPASFEAVARTISDEGKARLKAWEEGIKEGRIGGQPKTGNTAPGQTPAQPGPRTGAAAPTPEQIAAAPKLTADAAGEAAYKKLGPNTLFIAPDGTPHYTPAQTTAQAKPTAPTKPETKPEAQPEQRVARPTTQSEFDQVPSGSLYINPADGKTYKKK